MEKWFVYAILCDNNSIYKGHTNDIARRYEEHCKGVGATHTKLHKPVKLIYTEEVKSLDDAVKREKYLKSGIGREMLRKLVDR